MNRHPPEIDLATAWGIATWTVLVLFAGWAALVAGGLKRKFAWRFLPPERACWWTAGICSALNLAAMLGLVGLMIWRAQPFPLHSVAEGCAFVGYFVAPLACLSLAILFARKIRAARE